MTTPKCLLCPCGNTLSEETIGTEHRYHCVKCGYSSLGLIRIADNRLVALIESDDE